MPRPFAGLMLPLLALLAVLSPGRAVAGSPFADEQFERFSRLRGAKYRPESLNTYGQRFRDGVTTYLDYLANPTGFRPPSARSRTSAEQKGRPPVRGEGRDRAPTSAASPERTGPATRDLITYPFPLQTGDLAYVQLPVRFSDGDADRLCAFIRSIAIASE